MGLFQTYVVDPGDKWGIFFRDQTVPCCMKPVSVAVVCNQVCGSNHHHLAASSLIAAISHPAKPNWGQARCLETRPHATVAPRGSHMASRSPCYPCDPQPTMPPLSSRPPSKGLIQSPFSVRHLLNWPSCTRKAHPLTWLVNK